jgi:hypothetical protein
MVYVCHILGIKNKSVEFGNQGGISMFLYRGRSLRISDEFIREFADTVGVELDQTEADCHVSDILKVSPSSPEFAQVPDSEVLSAIMEGAQEDMRIMQRIQDMRAEVTEA